MEDPKVLTNILRTLQRLENRFEDQTDRLATIEQSVRSGATSPAPPSSTNRPSTSLGSSYSVEQMAADYQASVAKIRNRFEFVDDEVINDTGDWQSISVYSSRPQSQVLLEGFPLPSSAPPVPPKDGRRTSLRINTNISNENDTGNTKNNGIPEAALTFLVPPRFELLPTPPPTASSTSTSTPASTPLSSGPFTSLSESSPPTRTTSIVSENFNVRRPTVYSDSSERSIRAVFIKWRQWVHQHQPGQRSFRDSRMWYHTKSNAVERGVRMQRSAGRAVKGCLLYDMPFKYDLKQNAPGPEAICTADYWCPNLRVSDPTIVQNTKQEDGAA
ncbi:hypothetical protein B0T16DRAFT_391513 [Cercophora newfieldiana]|uniref:Uncharacterized protein n=1 Tax=Cercophora newfieldiana TaxID=92897 RepID=A0AA39Y0F8_9PEZI|nr:hypothetical protein B0T16DRAFT_391513 [Cercophora newfieldiana]